jgi:hypothetical protein
MTRHPFPLAHLVPPELTQYLLDFRWDLDLLHSLDLPCVEVPMATFADHLELPFWAYGGRPFQVAPREVAADRVTYAEQWARTVAAELRWPMDVVRRPDGRLTVLDGVHRLLKASVAGQDLIVVRVLAWEELERIVWLG